MTAVPRRIRERKGSANWARAVGNSRAVAQQWLAEAESRQRGLVEHIAQEIEAEAKKYRGEDADYGAGMRQAAAVVRRVGGAS